MRMKSNQVAVGNALQGSMSEFLAPLARSIPNTVRGQLVMAAALIATALAAPALADSPMAARHDVSIEPQPIAAALNALAAQTGLQIVVVTQDVGTKLAPAVHGSLTSDQALDRILEHSGLIYRKIGDNTFAIRKAAHPSEVKAGLHSTSYQNGATTLEGTALTDTAAGPDAAPAATASGADQAGGEPKEQEIEQVVVTGSRLQREGMTSPTPITQLSVQELHNANPQSLAQGLAQLPSMSTSTVPGSQGGRTSAGPGTFLSLRGLGSNRNLILLDGMRVAPTNVLGNVDVNLLPQTLVKDVQIVTGGASAAYGSDAVAGVTNFILDTRFTGFKADLSGGESGVGDGQMIKSSFAWGGSFLNDRLHVITSFDWRDSKPAYQNNRAWTYQNCGIIGVPGRTTANATPGNPRQVQTCGVEQENASYGGVIVSGPWVTSTRSVSFGAGGVPEAFIYGSYAATPAPLAANPTAAQLTAARLTGLYQVGGTGDPTLQGDVTNFYTPLDNKVLFGRVGFDFTDNIEGFAQLTATRTHSYSAQTPPYFNGSNPLTIFSGNPFIPATVQSTMTAGGISQFSLGITPKSWGVIETDTQVQSYDATVGVKGKFAGSWSWDAHVERGRTQWREAYLDDISMARLYRALDSVVDPASGATVCRVTLTNPSAANNQCVPLNPFGAGSASPAALNYIHGTMWQWNVVVQDSAAADISGEPFSLWAGPVSVGTGIEWRRLEGSQSSDATAHNTIDFTGVRGFYSGLATQVGGWATSNILPYSGTINVTEGYVETLIPLLKDQFLAKSLDLNAAARETGYSQSGTVTTWKAGLTYRPVDDLLLRASESRDIRAPGISDLYAPVALGPPAGYTDTPHGGTPIRVSVGGKGNPDLTPETAKTFTGGFTYQPSWLTGAALSADYYDIKIAEAMAAVGAQDTLDRCALGQTLFCGNIIRDGSGNVLYIYTPTENLNQARTRGVDLEASYRVGLGAGTLSFRTLATKLLEQSTTSSTAKGQSYIDNAGVVGALAPSWILNASVDWAQGPWSLDLNSRYVSGGRYSATYTASDLDSLHLQIPSNITFNTSAHYTFRSVAGSPELYLQVQNLFGRDPPIVPGGASLIGFQTLSSLYDTMGRFFSAGVRVSF